MRAKRVLGSKTGGQQSPIPELNDPCAPPEWERPDEVRRGRGEEEEERREKAEGTRGVSMSSMSRLTAAGWGSKRRIRIKDQGRGRIRQSPTW